MDGCSRRERLFILARGLRIITIAITKDRKRDREEWGGGRKVNGRVYVDRSL